MHVLLYTKSHTLHHRVKRIFLRITYRNNVTPFLWQKNPNATSEDATPHVKFGRAHSSGEFRLPNATTNASTSNATPINTPIASSNNGRHAGSREHLARNDALEFIQEETTIVWWLIFVLRLTLIRIYYFVSYFLYSFPLSILSILTLSKSSFVYFFDLLLIIHLFISFYYSYVYSYYIIHTLILQYLIISHYFSHEVF